MKFSTLASSLLFSGVFALPGEIPGKESYLNYISLGSAAPIDMANSNAKRSLLNSSFKCFGPGPQRNWQSQIWSATSTLPFV